MVFYVHQSKRHDSTHPGLFTSWGALPIIRTSIMQAEDGWHLFFFRNFFCRNFSHGEIRNLGPSTQQVTGCQPKTFKTFILMVKPLKPLFFTEKPLFEMTNLYF